MDSLKNVSVPAFVRKRPPDVRLHPEIITAKDVPTPNSTQEIGAVQSTGVSPTPVFHFELPSRPTTPNGGATSDPLPASGAASSQAQSPSPPHDEAERVTQFARFKQEVNRRMNLILRTQLLPSQPTSPAPDQFAASYAWPLPSANTNITTTTINFNSSSVVGVNSSTTSPVPMYSHAFRSSLHPDAAHYPAYSFSGYSLPSSSQLQPQPPPSSNIPSPQPEKMPLSSRPNCSSSLLPTIENAVYSSPNQSPVKSSPNQLTSTICNSKLSPKLWSTPVIQTPSGEGSDTSVSSSTSLCHCGLRLVFTFLKIILVLLLLLSCARLSTLFFSISDRVKLYAGSANNEQRTLKLRICFQLIFSFALLVQLIELYGVMYERFCLSGTFAVIQLAILTLMALDARGAGERLLSWLWISALALTIVYVIFLREMKRRRRKKRRRRAAAAAEAAGSHPSTPYHEWCAQERRRIREQMKAAGQLNAMGGIVGSEPIGATSGPIGLAPEYGSDDEQAGSADEGLLFSVPGYEEDGLLMDDGISQELGGYGKNRFVETPDEGNYYNFHFVNDEPEEEELSRDCLSKQLIKHFEEMRMLGIQQEQMRLNAEMQFVQQKNDQQSGSTQNVTISDGINTAAAINGFNSICREESVECQIDLGSLVGSDKQQLESNPLTYNIGSNSTTGNGVKLEQLDVKKLEQVRPIVNDKHLNDSQTSPLVIVDVDSDGERKTVRTPLS